MSRSSSPCVRSLTAVFVLLCLAAPVAAAELHDPLPTLLEEAAPETRASLLATRSIE